MRTYARLCVTALILCLLLLGTSCTLSGEVLPYDSGSHAHSFSGQWFDVAPATEGAPVTEEVHYCRICHAAETRPKE
jgi:hypothetical protein